MRILFKITVFVAIIFLIALTGLHIFVNTRGKELLTKKLQSVFGEGVRVGSVTTGLPFNLIIRDLGVKDWFSCRQVVAGMGLFDVLGDDFILSELKLDGLSIVFERKRRRDQDTQEADAGPGGQPAAPEGEAKVLLNPPQAPRKPLFARAPGRAITLRQLVFTGADISFIDYTAEGGPVTVALKDVNAVIEGIQWPLGGPQVTFFKLRGVIPSASDGESGRVRIDGWMNFLKKDMRATIEVDGMDALTLKPYFSDWVDVEKARIQKAKLKFTGTVTSLRNDVLAACHTELTQIEFKPRAEDEKKDRLERITQAVLGMLGAQNQGTIVLDFTYKTKFDSPEFGVNVIRDAIMEKMYEASRPSTPAQQMIQLPGRVIQGAVTTASDLTKSVIDNTVSIGQEFTDAVKATFSQERDRAMQEETDGIAADLNESDNTAE